MYDKQTCYIIHQDLCAYVGRLRDVKLSPDRHEIVKLKLKFIFFCIQFHATLSIKHDLTPEGLKASKYCIHLVCKNMQ